MSKGIAVIPLAKFTSEADHKLVADLATSVERNATLALLKKLGGETKNIVARKLLKQARDTIEAGKHIP